MLLPEVHCLCYQIYKIADVLNLQLNNHQAAVESCNVLQICT